MAEKSLARPVLSGAATNTNVNVAKYILRHQLQKQVESTLNVFGEKT